MRPIRNAGIADYHHQGVKTPYKKNSGSSGSHSSGEKKIQDPVEVYCRLKPCQDPYSCISIQSPTILTLNANKNRKEVAYGFNHIFTQHADQREIFDHIAIPLLNGLLQGENGLLFAYGVTSAGKTYTMMGEQDNPGVIPRSVNILFNTIQLCQTPKFLVKSDKLNGFEIQEEGDALTDRLLEAKQKRKQYVSRNELKQQFSNDGTVLENMDSNLFYAVFITYVEIYNNIVYDLLDESPGLKVLQSKILREDHNHNVYVNNAVEIEAKTADEALELFNLGSKRKRMAHTSLNSDSSRSHSIFTIRLVITNTDGSSNSAKDRNNFMVSQLSLVDLAGSERCNRSQTTGQRLKEAGRINNSLLTLRTCLEILRENQQNDVQRMVPYRESRLTHLFKNYFEGEGKVKMIVCVNPSIKDYDENLFVLKFAEITQDVKILRPEIKLIETAVVSDAFSEEDFQQIRSHRRSRRTLPRVRLINPDSDEITSLILYMKRRQQTMTNFKMIRTLSDKFRLRLCNLQKDKDDFQRQVEHLLPAERERVKSLKNKVLELGYEHDKVVKRCEEKDETIAQLQKVLAQKELEIRQGAFEKVKHKRKIEEVSEKMTHELDAKLRHQRDYLTAQMKEQNEKLELVKDIVSNGTPGEKSVKSGLSRDKTVKSLASILSSKIDVQSIPSPSITEQMDQGPSSQPHLPRRDAPVANKRYRRSRSAGDVWVEHRPAMPTPLGTVLQPVINRRKSLTKLTKKKEIVNPKQSKYLLISQNKDEEGELETKLYKGDIIPTCSGGAQVIFDDVERLKQESPVKCDSAKKYRMEH